MVTSGLFLFAFGYDDSLIDENSHPIRDDLDKVCMEHPIALTHVSGHLATGNSLALQIANITADSKDPAGGLIRRRTGSSEPNGVLEEAATYPFRAPMMKMATPGTSTSHHAAALLRAPARSEPQVMASAGTPIPRKLRPDSARMAPATPKAAGMSTGAIALGRMWMNMIREEE